MFIENLINQGNAPMLTELLKFTSQRHKVLAENILNIDTPNYRQKDLSVEQFQKMLQSRIEQKETAPPGSVSFDDMDLQIEHPQAGILSHDGNNRSMDQLISDQAKNALTHNLVVELLRKQFASMEMALKERVS